MGLGGGLDLAEPGLPVVAQDLQRRLVVSPADDLDGLVLVGALPGRYYSEL